MTNAAPTETAAVDLVLDWFAEHGRDWPWRRTRDRWHILIAEVCLQQTQVERARPHVERILERFPTPDILAQAPLSELLELWHGLGYPRRARNLWLASQQIVVSGWPEPLTELPGVGPYTAAAIRCFADGEAVLPPDINTGRVVQRLFAGSAPTPDHVPRLEADSWSWGQAVMELGQRYCRARAQCEACPVRDVCPSVGTSEVIASARQRPYEGSMRQRRGVLLRRLEPGVRVPFDEDAEAASTLVTDRLAGRSACGQWLVQVELHDT